MIKRGRAARPLVHRVVDSPVGRLLVVASDRGLVKISFDAKALSRELTARELSTRAKPGTDPDASTPGVRILDESEEQLAEYFAGKRKFFALVLDMLPTLPLSDAGTRNAPSEQTVPSPWVSPNAEFRVMAQLALQEIPYGETMTYGQLAEVVGVPRAARAVGSACATNPLPIVLPCHRVTKSGGSLGNYTGGVNIKRALLQLERDHA